MKAYIYSTLYITLYCAESRKRRDAQDLIGNGQHNGFSPRFQLLCSFGANMGAESMMPNGSCTTEKNPYKSAPVKPLKYNSRNLATCFDMAYRPIVVLEVVTLRKL